MLLLDKKRPLKKCFVGQGDSINDILPGQHRDQSTLHRSKGHIWQCIANREDQHLICIGTMSGNYLQWRAQHISSHSIMCRLPKAYYTAHWERNRNRGTRGK